MDMAVIVVAGGRGRRLGSETPKQFLKVKGQMILTYSLDFFDRLPEVKEIVVVLPSDWLDLVSPILKKRYKDKIRLTVGGESRSDSVRQGLRALAGPWAKVAVHDGVRPFVTQVLMERLIQALAEGHPAVIPAIELTDTIKQVDGDQVIKTLPRSLLRAAQTPQLFDRKRLWQALDEVDEQTTDEASLFESANQEVVWVEGDINNVKITTEEDFEWMQWKLAPDMRVGIGYDVHAFCKNKKLVLGGIGIDHAYGLKAHSDGDVVVHAVMDALLGAAGLGDIGQHFPDLDASYAGISSLVLLEKVAALLVDDYAIANIDVTIVAQAPKLAAYLPSMEKTMAETLNLAVSQVNVKATTTECLGSLGREEGMACQVVCGLKYKKAI